MTIERPRPEDAEAIYEIFKKSWHSTYVNKEIGVSKEDIDAIYTDEEKGKVLESISNRALNPRENEVELVARDENKILGVMRQVIHDDYIELRTLYIDPVFFQKGIGTKLWEESLKLLPKNKPINVEVATYTRAVNFYKKLGFIDTGERYTKDESVMKVSGTRMPLMKMVFYRDQNLRKIIDYLEERYSPLAILITGSRAYGKPREDSDWDMTVITENTTERIKEEWNGLNLDVHILHKNYFKRNFAKDWIPPVAKSKVIKDTDGVGQRLVDFMKAKL